MTQRVNLIYALAAFTAHTGGDRQAQLDGMEYGDYLRTPEWWAIRREKLAEAGYRCQVCRRGGRLDIHHDNYPQRGTEKNKDLLAACRDCHNKIHGVKK